MNQFRPFGRFACWLSRGDNGFNLMLFTLIPPLAAIVTIGFFGT